LASGNSENFVCGVHHSPEFGVGGDENVENEGKIFENGPFFEHV